MEGFRRPYLLMEGFCILYALTILLRLHRRGERDQDTVGLKRILLTYICEAAADMCGALAEGDARPWARAANTASSAVSVAAVALGCYFWFDFVERRLEPEKQLSRRVRAWIAAPPAAVCALDLASAGTGWIFYVDGQGRYQLGPLFWMQAVVTFAYLLVPALHAVIGAIRARQWEKRRKCLGYALFIAIPLAASAAGEFFPDVPLLEMAIFAAILFLFLMLYVDRGYELARKERELTESRMATMLSQIQPHFLYNTLGTISALCRSDPARAEQVTQQFAEFLRGNLDSLTNSRTIPFSQELAHTRDYLAIEQVRFGGRLRTQFDIAAEDFRLPTLTLQPLAENAVRHGVTRREEGGTVKISARETAAGYEVRVTDDGVGFEPAQTSAQGELHIGIRNVRERIERMCGGTLTVTAKPGAGTEALIRIPKERRS